MRSGKDNMESGSEEHFSEHASPDAEFAKRLERDIAFLVRRAGWLERVRRPRRVSLMTTIAIVVMCSTALGATGTLMMTSQSRGDYRLALLRAETALTLSRDAEVFAETQRHEVEVLVAAGDLSRDQVEEWQLESIDARENRRLRESEVREVQYRRASPVDELSAKQPGGRDFVMERIHIRLEAVGDRRAVHTERLERQRDLLEINSGPGLELSRARGLVEAQIVESDYLVALQKLRERFNSGQVSARRAELEAERLDLDRRLHWLRSQGQQADHRLQELVVLVERGSASQREQRAAEHADRELATRISSCESQIRVIQSMLEHPDQPE